MSDDLFLKIINREIPADIIHESERIIAFHDINPQAPVHILVIPKERIATLDDAEPEKAGLIGELFLTAAQIARDKGLGKAGYRVVMNCGRAGGQTVSHIHVHLLGGRQMHWPPG